MNTKFLTAVKKYDNRTLTQNGATAYKSTLDKLLDLFAFGGAYRQRSDEDCERLFAEAFYENKVYALKCLFYLRDIRGGQGERRFFRVCAKWLANNHPDLFRRNLVHIPTFGRWDDLLCLLDTPLKNDVLRIIKKRWSFEVMSDTPLSLFFKWMPSINASSKETKNYARIIRKYLKLSEKEYRKILAEQRKKIKVLERLMADGDWDKIEFDKLPSKAGLKYRKAFRTREELAERYAEFMGSKETQVNAGALYPYDVVKAARDIMYYADETEINTVNKYWENLTDYFNECSFNGIAVVDVSGSMTWSGRCNILPIDVAISIGIYCADKCSGPFKDHFFTFSETPELVTLTGDTFYQKFKMMNQANWGNNTNIESIFNMILSSAIESNLSQKDIPQNLIIISDMQFDEASGEYDYGATRHRKILFDVIEERWKQVGYKMPHLIFWNVNASTNIIPQIGEGYITHVSGCSPVILEQILKGKSGYDLCMDKLNEERYECIY